jgi:hypothetical protein
MTLRLVTEARPIPFDQLSKFEQDEIGEADGWIKAVSEDAHQSKPDADKIDSRKSGRVLFIDGPRGAGKTSLLLTLLERWRGESAQKGGDWHREHLKVLLPILDFDPLPNGLPLHGWLLEPWRKLAVEIEKESRTGVDNGDLSELWADVFERAVLGWSNASAQGKSVVERALAFQEQALGWSDMRNQWHKLVNTAVCRTSRCTDSRCRANHSRVFVIAIDDVDLQVEHVPELLHSMRLLHHPNVVYVLTGERQHLKFVIELDYIRRHGGKDLVSKTDLEPNIRRHSVLLRDSILEKALPSHAVLELPLLALDDVMKMYVKSEAQQEGKSETVRQRLSPKWVRLAEAMGRRGIVTLMFSHFVGMALAVVA